MNDHLTKTALEHHLKILVAASKIRIKELSSPYLLFSKFKQLKTTVKKIYVCRQKDCDAELVLDGKLLPLEVQPCGHKHLKNGSSCCYLLDLPIEDQIVHYIKTYHSKLEKDFAEEDPNFRSNVSSGGNYRTLVKNGTIDNETLTLQINTDGAQTFKSSKYGIWPLMAIINETDYKIRRSSIILISLWYGNKKPPRDTLLSRAVEKLNLLQSSGIVVDGVNFKIRVLVISTDTVARPLVRNSTQFNGEFGCDFCLHPGEQVPKGKGSVRVYPQPYSTPTFQPRSLEQHKSDLNLAQLLGVPIRGIVGPNPFEKLTDFDHVEAYVPEYLHSCCLGVFKFFIHLWTDKKHKKQKWYIGHLTTVINARLGQAKPPYDVSRTIDSIGDLSNWKASMYRTFTLYYFHLLEDILPAPYFDHYSCLVYGMFLLLQERARVDDILKVEILFNKFVVDTEFLYGIQHISINVHFLTHLPGCVMKWGCLWATSAFIPEWFNGVLLSMCKGSKAITEQMSSSYLLNIAVREEAINLLKTNELPPNIEILFKDLLKLPVDSIFSKGKLINNGEISLLGKSYNRELSIVEIEALRNELRSMHSELTFDYDLENCQFFHRFRLNSIGSIFTTSSYTKSPKRVNYVALLKKGKFICIENIVFIPKISCALVIFKYYGSISQKTFVPDRIGDTIFKPIDGQTSRLLGKSSFLHASNPCDIEKKCILTLSNELTETYLVTSMANHFETD